MPVHHLTAPCRLCPIILSTLDRILISQVDHAGAVQSIPGVPALHQFGKDAMACNPADWMLRISEPKSEDAIGVDFADIFRKSSAYRYLCHYPHRHSAWEKSQSRLIWSARSTESGCMTEVKGLDLVIGSSVC